MRRPALAQEHPIAIAHRGSMKLWPENTMVAFQGAIDLGYRYLETDVHATRDGVLIAFHDPTLDRTTSGAGRVIDHDYADLRGVDAGHNHGEADGYPHRGRGITIPTLAELFMTFPDVVVTVDLKGPKLEGHLADFVRRHDVWDRIIVGSFHDDRLRRFRKLTSGRVATSSGPMETFRFWSAARAGRSAKIKADALQVPQTAGPLRVVDAKTVAAAHTGGMQVHVWTVNDRGTMIDLLDLGVDGIITDRPDLLREVLIERGQGGPWNRREGATG